MPPDVRLADERDVATLSAIHRSAFGPGQAWSDQAIQDQLRVVGTSGLICGMTGMALTRFVVDEAEILTIAVDPSARRQGIGRALMTSAMQRARQCGIHAMYLEVAAANAAAQALYRGLGFSQVGVRRRYYEDGADALVMTAELA